MKLCSRDQEGEKNFRASNYNDFESLLELKVIYEKDDLPNHSCCSLKSSTPTLHIFVILPLAVLDYIICQIKQSQTMFNPDCTNKNLFISKMFNLIKQLLKCGNFCVKIKLDIFVFTQELPYFYKKVMSQMINS
jgi:hypothetical protein